jgi:Ran GTPase-activating protein (RanGAP) involved in mRNA processing and transport
MRIVAILAVLAAGCASPQAPPVVTVESPAAPFVRYWTNRLEAEPGPGTWRDFSAALLSWRVLTRPQVARLDAALVAWPDASRRAPDEWKPFEDAPERLPAWSLIRSVELTDADAPVLASPLPHLATVVHVEVVGDLAMHALAATSSLPGVRAVAASGVTIESTRALARARGSRLARLDLWENNLGDELGAVLAERNWPVLEHLEVGANRLTAESAAAIAGLDAPALRSLGLSFNGLGPDGLTLALSSGHQLRKLNLRAAGADSQVALALATVGTAELESLDVSDNAIGDDGVVALAHLPLPKLSELRLNAVGMTQLSATELAGAIRGGIAVLELSRNELHDAGAATLCAEGATGIRLLKLDATRLTDAAVQGLASCEYLRDVESLSLHNNDALTSEGVAALGAARFPRLTAVGLDGCTIGDAGFVALARATWWPQLTHLRVEANQITDGAVRAIFHSPPPRLTNLGLGWNELAAGSAEMLASADLPQLRILSLRGNALDAGALQALAEAAWLRRIEEIDLRSLAFDGLGLALEAIEARVPRGSIVRRDGGS